MVSGEKSLKRLSPDERKRRLLEKAIEYFSEEGFDGSTRELARQMGVTQPLIYRYFCSKADLINEVYNAVYLAHWKEDWVTDLQRRDWPLRDRLLNFYDSYTRTIFNRRWMRIFFFAGLKGLDINTRYVQRVSDHLLRPICMERRAELGFDTELPLRQAEFDLVWMMNGIVFYQGIREHIYRLTHTFNHAFSIEVAVDMYLDKSVEVIEQSLKSDTAVLASPASSIQQQQVLVAHDRT